MNIFEENVRRYGSRVCIYVNCVFPFFFFVSVIYLIANISVSILIEQMEEDGNSGCFEELGMASSCCNIRFSIGREL